MARSIIRNSTTSPVRRTTLFPKGWFSDGNRVVWTTSMAALYAARLDGAMAVVVHERRGRGRPALMTTWVSPEAPAWAVREVEEREVVARVKGHEVVRVEAPALVPAAGGGS